MIKNKVVKLMLQDASAFHIGQLGKEHRIIKHFKVTLIGHTDASGRQCAGSLFIDASRQSRKKRLIDKQASGMTV